MGLFDRGPSEEMTALTRQLADAEAAFETMRAAQVSDRAQLAAAQISITRLELELATARAQLAHLTGTQPPDHLQIRQVGSVWGDGFYREGRVIFDQLAEALRVGGQPVDETPRILDFGCGCGRVLRSFQDVPHRGEVWGCDIDGESIAWDRAHLGHIGQFYTNPVLPPMQFPDGFFSAIYAVSVFTHLPEEMQFAWLSELRRVLRPGGVLVASLHGPQYWEADPGMKLEMAARGFAYRTGQATAGLPDFYMVAFHNEDYIRTRWSRFFEVVDVKSKFVHGAHDAAILRRRAD